MLSIKPMKGSIMVCGVVAFLMMMTLIQPIMPSGEEENMNDIKATRYDRSFAGDIVHSLDGEYDLAETALTTFIGDDTTSPLGKLGKFVDHLDVNGDGLDDIIMAAPDLYSFEGEQNAGICYIFYGNSTVLSGNVDLKNAVPDITIKATSPRAFLLSSISMGDLDGDGYMDMVLGMPEQAATGKVYVLWGDADGWDSEIVLYNAGLTEPNGDPIDFLNTDSFSIIAGYVTMIAHGIRLGENVMIDDLDGDGEDDLLFSFHGWNKVFIVWGGYDRSHFGDEYTYYDMDPTDEGVKGDYGGTLAIGDIDGDGNKDLAVGAPYLFHEDRSLNEVGGVFIYFNIGDIRGNNSLPVDTLLRPLIRGSDANDRLGSGLIVRDLNGDGKDDILIGGPGADGPMNNRRNVGQIVVFMGDDIETFSNYLDAELDSDVRIFGRLEAEGDRPGDSIGSIFDVGDIDGDGGIEMLIGTPGRERNGHRSVGMVSGYDDKVIFPSGGGTVDLASVESRFSLLGSDPEDTAGYSVSISDVNNDGIDDILVGAPSADGFDNLRPNTGEVYQFIGSNMSIEDVQASGSAFVNGMVLPSYGWFDINVSFRHSIDPLKVRTIELTLDREAINATFIWNGSAFLYDGVEAVELDGEASSIRYSGLKGTITFRTRIGWFSNISRDWDMDVTLNGSSDSCVYREFKGSLPVNNNIILTGDADLLVDGKEILPGDWLVDGSELCISGLELIYEGSGGRQVPSLYFELVLYRDEKKILSVPYNGTGTELIDHIPEKEMVTYSIRSYFNYSAANGQGPGDGPVIEGEILIELNIDTLSPDPVKGLRLIPDPGRVSLFDDEGEWEIEWTGMIGAAQDENTSGIRGYDLRFNDGQPFEVMGQGGLFGAYYVDPNFVDQVFGRVDPSIHFTEHDWGYFGPDDELIPQTTFSVKWRGWFRPPETRNYRFSIVGDGDAMIILNGNRIFDWDTLYPMRNSDPLPLVGGEAVPLEVFYRNADDFCSFSFQYVDDGGDKVPVPRDLLLYPTNRTVFTFEEGSTFNATVRSLDLAGHSSEPVTISGYIDNTDPVFDTAGVDTWHGLEDPNITFLLRDPVSGNIPSSGIDLTSLAYRTRETGEIVFSPWEEGLLFFDVIEQGLEAPVEMNVTMTLDLTPGWTGAIQITASDIVGNGAISRQIQINVDLTGPTFEVISPDLGDVQPSGDVTFTIKARDRDGSGIDPGTVEYKLDPMSGGLNWTPVDIQTGGDEILFSIVLSLPEGDSFLVFRCIDMVGNQGTSDAFGITAENKDPNMPPIISIDAPIDGAVIYIGNPVTFDCSGTTDDGLGPFDAPLYTWFSSKEGYLGSGRVITVYLNDTGEHRIILYVDDGQYNVSGSINVTVFAVTQGDDNGTSGGENDGKEDLLFTMLIISAIAIVLILLFLVLVRRYRKDQMEEVKLDLLDRTEDDILYNEREGEE